MKKSYHLILFLICTPLSFLFAQGENLFNDDIVHEIYLSFDESNFWSTLTSNYDDNYPDVPYIMANVAIDGTNVDSIGVRLKGFSSYWVTTDKKSIKIDFNEFVSGKKYDGLKKININNGEGDPAIQRDKLCYDIMRNADVNAPRTSYAKIYLNDTYWGLYLLVEQVDKTFLKTNFGNKDGNLFKNMGNSELDWLGTDTVAYQAIFELKTDAKAGAWERFVELMDVINRSTDTDFKTAIDAIFDVDLYLRVLATDVATNNWDSYIEHGRNFYMYDNPETMKFEWIPWDYNLAIGGQFSGNLGGGGPDGNEIGNPEDCSTIINGTCPYPAEDTIFVQVIELDAFCCNTEWDGICQDLYDTLASGNDPNDNGGGGPGGPGGNSSEFPIDMSNSEKVLIKRLLEVPEFMEMYQQHWCSLLDDNMTTDRLFPMIEANGDLIRSAIADDPNYVWTLDNFEEDLDQGNDYIPGLKKFFEERTEGLATELEGIYDCQSIVSANKWVTDNQLQIYPNPTNGILNIAFTRQPEAGTTAFLYNSVGQLVLQKEITNETTTLSVNDFVSGFYTLSIENQKAKLFVNKKVNIVY